MAAKAQTTGAPGAAQAWARAHLDADVSAVRAAVAAFPVARIELRDLIRILRTLAFKP
jgi:hypothetical protein